MTYESHHPHTINETQRAYIAKLINEEENEIQATTPYWARLMKEGLLIRLHIGRWRAKRALTWSDLGIEINTDTEKNLKGVINLGYKTLLPTKILKELDAIESKARKWLKKMSFETYWGAFVPTTAYQDWKKEHEKIKSEYYDTSEYLSRNYKQIKYDTLAAYKEAANEAYARLNQLSPKSLEGKTRADFVTAFTRSIEASIPPVGTIIESFTFEADLEYIPLPSLMAEDLLEAERLQAEREQIETKRNLRQEKDALTMRTLQTAEEDRLEALQVMNKDVLNDARVKKEKQIDIFLEQVTTQLRSMVYNTTVDALDKIQKQEKLGPRSVVQLKNMIKQVRSLNFYDDKEVSKMIQEVSSELNQRAKDRDIGQIESKLTDIGTILRASLITLGQEPRSQRLANITQIPNDPSEAELNRARRNLRLTTEEELPILLDLNVRQSRIL